MQLPPFGRSDSQSDLEVGLAYQVVVHLSHVCKIGGFDQDPIAPPVNPLDLSQRMDRVAFLAEFFPEIRPGNPAGFFRD
jgi:hypothetical protein